MALLAHKLTVQEETVADAVAAVTALADHQAIDAQRIYVLGHSLGGYLIPRIAAQTEVPSGYISLAGSSRPLEDLVVSQVAYLANLDGEVSEEELALIDSVNQQVAVLKSPDFSAETRTSELPLSVPASYWLDLRDYRPAADAKQINKPMLFLQGERDYQVIDADFQGWKKALVDRADVKFIAYPGLNHLLQAGEGPSQPGEYLSPGHVDLKVIEDIANWINQ